MGKTVVQDGLDDVGLGKAGLRSQGGAGVGLLR
jgi:hypothetical protein